MKVYVALAYTLVFWVLSLAVQHYQANLLVVPSTTPSKNDKIINPPFWDNFGLSCISNVLMGSLYLVIYMGDIAFRKMYCANKKKVPSVEPKKVRVRTDSNNNNEMIFCVEEEHEEEEQYSSQNILPNSSILTIELPKEEESGNKQDDEVDTIVLHVTPGLLWYYMYTTGWGVFCMAYTLHGAHWISSLCLCSGSLFCSIWGALRGRFVNNHNKRTVMCFLVIFNLISVCMCTSLICGHPKTLLWRSWVVEIACPLIAPFWLLESKDKMIPMNMPKQSMVLFGLPFTSMISAGYLSMYIPLQGCANGQMMMNSQNNTYILENTTTSAGYWTPLITEKNILGQSIWGLLLSGLIVPGLMYLSFVFYSSAFQKIDSQLLCANSLWLVLATRIWMEQRDDVSEGESRGFGTITVLALLGWFAALLFVLLHHFENDTLREWRDVYGDILLVDDCDTIEPVASSSNTTDRRSGQ